MRRAGRGLLVAGTVGTVLGLSKAHALAHTYDYSGSPRLAWSVAYMALLVTAAYGVGLPEVPRTRRSAALGAIGSTMAASVGISVLQLLAGSALLPRFVVLTAPAVLLPIYVLCAAVASDGRSRAEAKDRLVVVAGLSDATQLADELAAGPERPAVVAAVIGPAAASSTGPGSQPLVDLVASAQATALVLDRVAQADESIVAQAARAHEAGVRVRTLSLCYDEWLGKLPVGELERVGLMFDIGEVHRAYYGRVKRLMDIALASAGLVALALVAPVVVVANRFGNRGPLLFRQARVGKQGRRFELLKFRTMTPGSDDSGWTVPGDPRVTRVGGWLRRAHLDELPQVLNILRGELSIVGPRPEQPHYVDELTAKIPFYRLRHLVRPGLTGWAQVKYRYGATEADALEKLQYEFYYLRHQGLALDLRILGRTLRTVVGRSGR